MSMGVNVLTKLKINYFSNGLGIGGSEKTEYLFAQNLNENEFTIKIFTYSDAALERKHDFERFCQVILLDRKNPNWNLLEDCDLLHTFRSGYNEAPEPGYHINVPHFVETNVFGFYDPNPKIDRSLFMSKWLMQHTIRQLGHKPDRFDFVNNPVEMPYTNDILPIAQRWQNENAIIVGRCGRPDNGIYNSINVEAVRLLRMQGYDIRFLVVAPPSNMISDLSRYEIPFYMIEPTVNPLVLSMFYNSIDIFAHARADGESGGCAIQEATIHKKSIVTHIATPSIPGMGVFNAQVELVENGKTGYIVNNNPLEYSEALKLLILDRDLRLQFGENAFSKAINEYEINVCMKKLENIYNDIMGQS